MEALTDVVGILQKALAIVRSRTHGELGITLVRAEINLNVSAVRKKVAGMKFEYFVPIKIGVESEHTTTHELTMTLTPAPDAADLGGTPETEDLADSIIQLASEATNVRKQVADQFTLSDFSISLQIAVNRDGQLQVVAGGEKGTEHGHQVKVTFRPK